MRKFKIEMNNESYFVIKIEDIKKISFFYLSVSNIKNFYQLSQYDILDLVYFYNGQTYHDYNNYICFIDNRDAQNFLDNVIVPYEIAFNLGK